MTGTTPPAQSASRSDRLNRVSTGDGRFAVLAIDHVRSFATTVYPDDPDSLSPYEMRESKRWLIDGLAPHAGAVLVDPGFLAAMADGWTDTLGDTGLILGIEDGDYEEVRTAPRLLPGWDVERAARLGVDAVKISFYFDHRKPSEAAEQFVKDVVAQCEAHDMPLFSEPLALYDRPEDRRGSGHRRGEAFRIARRRRSQAPVPRSVHHGSRSAGMVGSLRGDRPPEPRPVDHPVGGKRLRVVPRSTAGGVRGRRLGFHGGTSSMA